jgi:hypothetical protein
MNTASIKIFRVISILLGLFIFFPYGCSDSFKQITLPDGRVILVLRNIEDAFPVYATSFKAELELALKTKKEMVDLAGESKYSSDVNNLYENLDRVNMDVRNLVITGYSTFVTSMSLSESESERDKIMNRWDNIQQQIIVLTSKLRILNKQVISAKMRASSTEWDKLISIGHEFEIDAKNFSLE